jgi:hypothetical protein
MKEQVARIAALRPYNGPGDDPVARESAMSRLLYVILLVQAIAPRAAAHGLAFDCKRSGARIEVEAYFDDDTPARAARVQVKDEQQQIVAEGRTDEHGRWSFARPQPGRYVVVVDAGGGHRESSAITIGIDTDVLAPEPAPVSGRSHRERFTAFPWLKLGLGLAIIAGLGLAAWGVRRLARRAGKPPAQGGASAERPG